MISARIVSLIFGLAILLLGMKLLDKFFNRKAAIIFGILYSVIPWAVFTSVILDNDGTVICLAFIAMMYFTLKLIEKEFRDNKYFIIVGILSGFLVYLKPLPWIFVPVCNVLVFGYFMLYIKRMNFKKFLYNMIFFAIGVIIGIAILALILYIALGWWGVYGVVIEPIMLIGVDPHGISGAGFQLPFLLEIATSFIFISPIVLLFLLNIFSKKKDIKDKYIIFMVLFHILEIFGMLYMYNEASLSRYASFLMLLALLSISIPLSKIFETRKILFAAISGLALSIVYFLVDLLPHRILDFYPKSAWISNVLKFKWDFLVPINGASGPMGFYVPFFNIAIPFIICGLLSVIMIVLMFRSYKNKRRDTRKKNQKNFDGTISSVALAILVISLSYAFYFSIQYSYSPTSPSINNINVKIRTECASDYYYVFRNSAGISVQNNQSHFIRVKGINFESENDAAAVQSIVDSKEHVCVIDFPQISKSSILWDSLTTKCVLHKEYYDHGLPLGYWFDC